VLASSDATRKLLADAPGTKVIVLSGRSDPQHMLAMFAVGAAGYLLTRSEATELIEAVHAVTSGHSYVSRAIVHIMLDNLVEGARVGPGPSRRTPPGFPTVKPLTAREREVLQLLAEGKSSKEIAARLGVATPTVESHRRQITDKLGLRTIAELTKYAIRHGLTSLE
jgi:DNA-binding NarL/FixJ family response regulator